MQNTLCSNTLSQIGQMESNGIPRWFNIVRVITRCITCQRKMVTHTLWKPLNLHVISGDCSRNRVSKSHTTWFFEKPPFPRCYLIGNSIHNTSEIFFLTSSMVHLEAMIFPQVGCKLDVSGVSDVILSSSSNTHWSKHSRLIQANFIILIY